MACVGAGHAAGRPASPRHRDRPTRDRRVDRGRDARDAYAEAYTAGPALTAGFNWYRTFTTDSEHNQQPSPTDRHIGTPTLLLLSGGMAPLAMAFERGFRAAGHNAVTAAVLEQAGHFLPEEAPQQTWQHIADLIGG